MRGRSMTMKILMCGRFLRMFICVREKSSTYVHMYYKCVWKNIVNINFDYHLPMNPLKRTNTNYSSRAQLRTCSPIYPL